jgi:Transglycosylase SLT domain
VSELPDVAVRRWAEAAALLAGVGRVPVGLLGWLGSAWSGQAARAYEDWAALLERATRVTAAGLREAAESIQALSARWPELRFEADLNRVDAGARAIIAVPIPGQRGQPPERNSADRPAQADQPAKREGEPRRRAGPPDHHRSGDADQLREPRPPHRADDGPHDDLDAGPSAPPAHQAPSTAPHSGKQAQVAGWVQQAVEVLRDHGYRPDQIDQNAIATIIWHESSGNPQAVNDWDANAAHGTPAMGLMQTVRPTFERWHLPGHDQILDPVDNIIAGVRYAVARYGSVSRVPGVLSLAAGSAYRGY